MLPQKVKDGEKSIGQFVDVTAHESRGENVEVDVRVPRSDCRIAEEQSVGVAGSIAQAVIILFSV